MPALSNRSFGILEIILSGACFGFLGIFGKAAYAAGLSPGELLSLRFLLASLILGIIYLTLKPALLRIPRTATIKSLLLGVVGYAIFSSCYFEALSGLSASLTVLLLYLYPVLVSVGAYFLFGEKLTKLGCLALPLTCVGLVLLVWGDVEVNQPIALVFGFASAIFYATYILFSRSWLRDVSPYSSVFYVQLGAALALCSVHLRSWTRVQEMVTVAWPTLLGISVISTIIAMFLFLSGLRKITSAEASILSTTEPVVGILAATLLLGERLGWVQVVGAAVFLAAMILISLPPAQIKRANTRLNEPS